MFFAKLVVGTHTYTKRDRGRFDLYIDMCRDFVAKIKSDSNTNDRIALRIHSNDLA